MKANESAFMDLPIVKSLMKRVKKLEKKNKKLNVLNESLQRVVINLSSECCKVNSDVDCCYDSSDVEIKEEKIDTPLHIDDLNTDEIEIVDSPKKEKTANVVYEIEELNQSQPEWDYDAIKKNISSRHPNREIIYTDDGETMLMKPLAESAPPIRRVVSEVVEEHIEQEEEEEEEEEEKEEQEEKEEEEEEEQEEEEEVYETSINGVSYYVTDEKNGTIYEIDEDEEVGNELGKYENGVPVFKK